MINIENVGVFFKVNEIIMYIMCICKFIDYFFKVFELNMIFCEKMEIKI